MYAIDTAEVIRKLTAADMPEAQARVIVDTFKHPDAEIATKTDLETSINGLKQYLKTDIGRLEADIGKLQIGQTWLQWPIGLNLGLTLLIGGRLLFF